MTLLADCRPSDTEQLQADAAIIFDTVGVLKRDTAKYDDGYGHPTQGSGDPHTIVAALPCNLSRPSANMLRAIAEKYATLNVWAVAVPIGTDVHEGDTLTVGSDVMTIHNVATPESFPIVLNLLGVEVV